MEPPQVYPKVPFPTLCDWIFVQPDANEDSWTCTLCNTESIKKSNAPGNLIKHCASNKCVGCTMRGATHPRVHQDLQPLYKRYADWKATKTLTNSLGFRLEVSPFAKRLRVTSFIQTYQISHFVRELTSLCEHGPNTCSHLYGNGNGPKHSSHPRMSD